MGAIPRQHREPCLVLGGRQATTGGSKKLSTGWIVPRLGRALTLFSCTVLQSFSNSTWIMELQPARGESRRMSRTFLTFGDIAGKLHMLQIECTRCARKGRYGVAKLLVEHGHRGNMSKWVSDLRGDCPKRNAAHLNERCDLICPDLPKAL